MRLVGFLLLALALGCDDETEEEEGFDDPWGGNNEGTGGSDGGSGGGGGTADLSGYLSWYETYGGSYCRAWWSVYGLETSTECPECEFDLDWAYEVTYEWEPGLLEYGEGCERTQVGEIVDEYPYYTEMLDYYVSLWGFVSEWYYPVPEPFDGFFAIGYRYDDYVYFYPFTLAVLDAGEFRWDTYWRYEWYYDYDYDDDDSPPDTGWAAPPPPGEYGIAGEAILR